MGNNGVRYVTVKGTHRIYYKSRGSRLGLSVTAESDDGETVVQFAELRRGLYYADFEFPELGKFVWWMFEDGDLSTPVIFEIITEPSVIKQNSGASFWSLYDGLTLT